MKLKIIRVFWVTACLLVLAFYTYGRISRPDVPDYEEVVGYSMIALTFPVSLARLAIFGFIGDLTKFPSTMYSMWAELFVLGYLQWFVLLPWIVKRRKMSIR